MGSCLPMKIATFLKFILSASSLISLYTRKNSMPICTLSAPLYSNPSFSTASRIVGSGDGGSFNTGSLGTKNPSTGLISFKKWPYAPNISSGGLTAGEKSATASSKSGRMATTLMAVVPPIELPMRNVLFPLRSSRALKCSMTSILASLK
ncbi:unnamed protein product [Chondrus crispus]|uniref:Uncharacterized protein n=1 Tax=Chondrus crispus TaxID=2769 RepID=R7QQT2_CHOCR|nr:unnamed protein product [Chondrus crispus]CDF40103.1 unnamed protein product [Chondrus crispus]|eukprot:XP_005710397.1 unnamed protein product [Chondrus crispus]